MSVGSCIYLPTQSEISAFFLAHPTPAPTSTPTPTGPATATATPSPRLVTARLLDWPALLTMGGPHDEGTAGTRGGGWTGNYLTYPGAPEVTFEADNIALVHYPYTCRERYKTFIFGIEKTTADIQHQGAISARMIVSGSGKLTVEKVWSEGDKAGRCANAIIAHLQNLDGLVIGVP